MDRQHGRARPQRAVTRDEIFEEIKALAIAYTELKPDKIVPDARLLRDLHLDGDDAAGFMAAFTNKFDVDMSGFYWLRYFGDEGWDYLAPAMIAVARCDYLAVFLFQLDFGREVPL